MNTSETCLLKNKTNDALIYDSEKQYLLTERHDKYKTSELEKLMILLENSAEWENKWLNINTNIFSTTQTINKPNIQQSIKVLIGKGTLLLEIEHIIVYLDT